MAIFHSVAVPSVEWTAETVQGQGRGNLRCRLPLSVIRRRCLVIVSLVSFEFTLALSGLDSQGLLDAFDDRLPCPGVLASSRFLAYGMERSRRFTRTTGESR